MAPLLFNVCIITHSHFPVKHTFLCRHDGRIPPVLLLILHNGSLFLLKILGTVYFTSKHRIIIMKMKYYNRIIKKGFLSFYSVIICLSMSVCLFVRLFTTACTVLPGELKF